MLPHERIDAILGHTRLAESRLIFLNHRLRTAVTAARAGRLTPEHRARLATEAKAIVAEMETLQREGQEAALSLASVLAEVQEQAAAFSRPDGARTSERVPCRAVGTGTAVVST